MAERQQLSVYICFYVRILASSDNITEIGLGYYLTLMIQGHEMLICYLNVIIEDKASHFMFNKIKEDQDCLASEITFSNSLG